MVPALGKARNNFPLSLSLLILLDGLSQEPFSKMADEERKKSRFISDIKSESRKRIKCSLLLKIMTWNEKHFLHSTSAQMEVHKVLLNIFLFPSRPSERRQIKRNGNKGECGGLSEMKTGWR
jgi:hypothetical protein